MFNDPFPDCLHQSEVGHFEFSLSSLKYVDPRDSCNGNKSFFQEALAGSWVRNSKYILDLNQHFSDGCEHP